MLVGTALKKQFCRIMNSKDTILSNHSDVGETCVSGLCTKDTMLSSGVHFSSRSPEKSINAKKLNQQEYLM